MKSSPSSQGGFTLVESLVAVGLAAVMIMLCLSLTTQNRLSMDSLNKQSVAISILDQFAEKIMMTYTGNLIVNSSFSIAYDKMGQEIPAADTSTPTAFTLDADVLPYSRLNTLKLVDCRLNWKENGLSRRQNFRIVR